MCRDISGGDGGNRTRVRKSIARAFYGCSCCIKSPLYFSQQQDKYRASLRFMTKAEAGLCSPLPLVDALSYVAVVIGKTSSIKLLRQLYCCRLFLSLQFLKRDLQPLPAYRGSQPPSKPLHPHIWQCLATLPDVSTMLV